MPLGFAFGQIHQYLFVGFGIVYVFEDGPTNGFAQSQPQSRNANGIVNGFPSSHGTQFSVPRRMQHHAFHAIWIPPNKVQSQKIAHTKTIQMKGLMGLQKFRNDCIGLFQKGLFPILIAFGGLSVTVPIKGNDTILSGQALTHASLLKFFLATTKAMKNNNSFTVRDIIVNMNIGVTTISLITDCNLFGWFLVKYFFCFVLFILPKVLHVVFVVGGKHFSRGMSLSLIDLDIRLTLTNYISLTDGGICGFTILVCLVGGGAIISIHIVRNSAVILILVAPHDTCSNHPNHDESCRKNHPEWIG
mmetsp:Transcript_12392/g.19062  ORF Transcript_12392/g.19062 Transcript_12392/m.19062 type:complete len:303 (+) Transcript_12392:342-1250(+)